MAEAEEDSWRPKRGQTSARADPEAKTKKRDKRPRDGQEEQLTLEAVQEAILQATGRIQNICEETLKHVQSHEGRLEALECQVRTLGVARGGMVRGIGDTVGRGRLTSNPQVNIPPVRGRGRGRIRSPPRPTTPVEGEDVRDGVESWMLTC